MKRKRYLAAELMQWLEELKKEREGEIDLKVETVEITDREERVSRIRIKNSIALENLKNR